MAKRPRKQIPPTARPKRKTLAELNQWMTQHHAELMERARRNCIKLTGRPTFGGASRRKSA